MRKTEGTIDISVNVTCPHCEDYLDLMSTEHFQHLHDDAIIYNKLFGKFFGCKDFNETIICPTCKNEIHIGEIYW